MRSIITELYGFVHDLSCQPGIYEEPHKIEFSPVFVAVDPTGCLTLPPLAVVEAIDCFKTPDETRNMIMKQKYQS